MSTFVWGFVAGVAAWPLVVLLAAWFLASCLPVDYGDCE